MSNPEISPGSSIASLQKKLDELIYVITTGHWKEHKTIMKVCVDEVCPINAWAADPKLLDDI